MRRDRGVLPFFKGVNPLVPGVVAGVGICLSIVFDRWIGAGVAIGALLALANGILLSQRVELAARAGDMARALMVMQLGLLVTFAVVGVATVVLIHISLPLTLGCAGGFTTAHLGILGSFYWTHARSGPGIEGEAS